MTIHVTDYLTPTAERAWGEVLLHARKETRGYPTSCIIPALKPDGNGYVRVQRVDETGKHVHLACHLLALLYGTQILPIDTIALALADGYEVNHLCRQSDCCNPAHIAMCGIARNRAEYGNKTVRSGPRTAKFRFQSARSEQARKGRDVTAYDRIRETVNAISAEEGVLVPDELWVFVRPRTLARLAACLVRDSDSAQPGGTDPEV